jgi:hypothetical protein
MVYTGFTLTSDEGEVMKQIIIDTVGVILLGVLLAAIFVGGI